MKELGFQIGLGFAASLEEPEISLEKVAKPPSKMGQNTALLTARWYPPRDTQSRGPSLIPQTAIFCIAMDA